MSDLQSTPIQSLGNQDTVDDNQLNSEEEDISENMYGHQMDNNVNEQFTQQGGESYDVQPPKTMVSKMINTLKAPVIVLILFIFLNLKMVKTMCITLLSKIISPENALIDTGCVIIRGLICALLFFIINKFV